MTIAFEVSLTSHTKRFQSLYVVLSEILNWNILPELINLNLTQEDFKLLPSKIMNSEFSHLLRINVVEDWGPAKKLIPSLMKQRHLPIVTIDDDIHYKPDQITRLLVEHMVFPSCIIAGRAHRILLDQKNNPIPYLQWDLETKERRGPSKDLFPTGAGMVLYPLDVLHRDVFNLKNFSRDTFWTDDIWFYFQARRKGTLIRRVPHGQALTYVDGTQEVGLWQNGNQIRNDLVFSELIKVFGNPVLMD
jgi:hypothetical protein